MTPPPRDSAASRSAATPKSLEESLQHLTRQLLAERGPDGHWVGELSSSALSTAVAVIALGEVDRSRTANCGEPPHATLVQGGLRWLADHANADGGWGDTVRSRSNLSTTALVWAAFGAAAGDSAFPETVGRAHRWLIAAAGSEEDLVPAIVARYGEDRTFSVPIVLTLALSGRLGPEGWQRVPALPFELAALPRSWFGALRLPVVSYALPALIALGQAIHHHAPTKFGPLRALRNRLANRTFALLDQLQPPNGGFLEATPLTAFVTMSLASMGHASSTVVQRAASFLRASVRPDGSWPIDTNLATWTTTLAIKALHPQLGALNAVDTSRLRGWLLSQHYQTVHPYTGAPPGGWAWTDLPGGVPDADDTAGAVIALHHLGPNPESYRAATAGIRWLLGIQNRDGGIPTFCRGWGKLPFDRSSPELTAHALRAWSVWEPELEPALRAQVAAATSRAHQYLRRSQRSDGAWIPLWFGHEQVPNDENPVYGTAQVLRALPSGSPAAQALGDARKAALSYLVGAQNPDGSWGGGPNTPGSIEETSLGLAALADAPEAAAAVTRAAGWLQNRLDSEPTLTPSPIGLYFARLWYFERLYPLLFATDALGSFRRQKTEDRRLKTENRIT